MLLVRDVMTIGVPVCRDGETCGAVAARLEAGAAVVVLDEDGMACGWTTRAALAAEPAARLVAEVMDEEIPTVPVTAPAAAALELMRERGVDYLFLMHDWPGEPRPSAVVVRAQLERRLHQAA